MHNPFTSVCVALALVFIIAGCSHNAPECSSDEVTSVVLDLLNKGAVNNLGKELADKLTINLSAARTRTLDKNSGMRTCAADVEFQFDVPELSETSRVSLQYTIENTDKKGELYITLIDADDLL